jgi:hypothetical protein
MIPVDAIHHIAQTFRLFCSVDAMIDRFNTFYTSLVDYLGGIGVGLRVALSTLGESDEADEDADYGIDPDFEGWLHGNPLVTKNPMSRYADRTPGYITGNGLGSMEIGAADD